MPQEKMECCIPAFWVLLTMRQSSIFGSKILPITQNSGRMVVEMGLIDSISLGSSTSLQNPGPSLMNRCFSWDLFFFGSSAAA